MKINTLYFIYFLWFSLNLALLGLVYYLFAYTYEDITFQILDFYQKTDKLAVFRSRFVTPLFFQVLRLSFLSLMILNFGLFFYLAKISVGLNQQIENCSNKINQLIVSILAIFRKLSLAQKRIFGLTLGILILPKIYQLIYFPPLLDEVFSYIYLVDKGFLVSATYYPGPNNHVLFSLISVIFYQIFGGLFTEPVYALRLVSLLAFMLSICILSIYLIKYDGFHWAILGLLAWGFLAPVSLFAFLGRGYMLESLLVLVIICLVSPPTPPLKKGGLLNSHPAKGGLRGGIFLCIAGFYTVPTFLYPFLAIVVFQVFKAIKQNNLRILFNLFKSYFWIFIFTFLLYFPIIFLNGFSALVGNNWVKSLDFNTFISKIPQYFLSIGDFFFPDFGFLMVLIFILFLLNFIFNPKTNTEFSYLLVCFWLSPIFILLIQRVLPPERTWTYFSLILILTLIQTLKDWRWGKIAFTIFTFFILIYQIKDYPINPQTRDYQLFAKKVAQEKFQQIFVNEDTYQVFLRYEYLKKKQNIFIETQDFKSKPNFDLIVFSKNQVFPPSFEAQNFQVFYQDSTIIAFRNKIKN